MAFSLSRGPGRLGLAAATFGLSEAGGLRPLAERLFRGRGAQSLPDISAELARISSLFAEARKAAIAGINREAAQGRRAAASNLAGRGVLESPASENTFSALEEGRLSSISQAEGQLAGQEAGMRAQLLNSLLGLRVDLEGQERERADARRNALFGAGGSLLSQILLARLLSGAGTGAVGGPAGMAAGAGISLLPFLVQNQGAFRAIDLGR